MSYTIKYRIVRNDDAVREFSIHLNDDLIRVRDENASTADWTRLEFQQCSHCPLKPGDTPECPAALNIFDVIDGFAGASSIERVRCEVETPERTFSADVHLHNAIYSLLGLVIATSGCPHFTFLRPMARFHLPFATTEETLIRSNAFYLLGRAIDPESNDSASLDDLVPLYAAVRQANEALLARIRSAHPHGDADRNAIVVLDSFAQIIGMEGNPGIDLIRPFFNTACV